MVRVAGGLSVDVLLDRGLDLGSAWWQGRPIAWRSPHLRDPGPGREWEDRFLGGLLATCGPDNVGAARDGAGKHGTHHLTAAHDVRWWRERAGDEIEVHVVGSVGHTTLYGTRVVVDREIVVSTGKGWVDVRDTVRNVGSEAVGVPLLYHVNLGAAALVPGSRVVVDAGGHVLENPLPAGRDAYTFPEPGPGVAFAVAPTGLGAPGSGAEDAPEVAVEWRADTMPRLFTWPWPAAGAWVLGVEPANAPLMGPDRDLPFAGAPVLAPGESWECGVRVEVRHGSTDPSAVLAPV